MTGIVLSSNFTRPNNTTAYASGQLVANSTTPASVVPLAFPPNVGASGQFLGVAQRIRRARLKKSGTTVTLATFRLHLSLATPAPLSIGDGGVLSRAEVGYLGYFDLDMTGTTAQVFTDGAKIIAAPVIGTDMTVYGPGLFGLIEARAAYVPAANEVFTVELEIENLNNR